jgi:hypothetical protein
MTAQRMSRTPLPVLLLALIAAAAAAGALLPQPAAASDMLICRKSGKEGDDKGRVIHLHGKRLRSGKVRGVIYNAGNGNDVVYGTPGDDIINGGRGNDRVYGRGGNDIVCGGTDNDKVFGDAGNDAVYGEEHNDRIEGGPGTDYVLGGAGDDRVLSWGDDLDFADGDYGSDVVVGGAADQIFGSTENDNLSVRLAPDETSGAAYMNGGYDKDRITGSPFADHIQGNLGDDRIFGLDGDDILRGGGSNDLLYGGDGNDAVWGESNSDEMHGDDGDDELYGGDGKDSYYGDAGFDSCYLSRKNQRTSSCERVLLFQTPASALMAPPASEPQSTAPAPVAVRSSGFSGSASHITSDGYPFPDNFARIAGFKHLRSSEGSKKLRPLDKDSAHQQKPSVVALGTVYHPRELRGVITAGRGHKKIEWAYTNTCSRDYSSPDVQRSTDNHGTTPLSFKIPMPKRFGPKCNVAIWGKIDYSKGKRSLQAKLLYR